MNCVKQLEEETASGVQHNQNVMKRKDLQSIVQAATTTVSLQNRTGRRLVNQGQREFVPEGSWDEAMDGKWDASKVVTEDYGKGPVTGIWVMRGREGVMREENYQDESFDIHRNEADDSGLFGSERLKLAIASTSKIFNDADTKRKIWQCKVRPPANSPTRVTCCRY